MKNLRHGIYRCMCDVLHQIDVLVAIHFKIIRDIGMFFNIFINDNEFYLYIRKYIISIWAYTDILKNEI